MPSFASVILVDPVGRLLLQERDEHPVIDPDCWGLPGGHVEAGESAADAACRELAEETGVVLPPGTLAPFGAFDVWHEAYGSLDRIDVYAGRCDLGDADIDCREGRRMIFVASDDLAGRPLTAGFTVILPAFLSSDLYRSYRRLVP